MLYANTCNNIKKKKQKHFGKCLNVHFCFIRLIGPWHWIKHDLMSAGWTWTWWIWKEDFFLSCYAFLSFDNARCGVQIPDRWSPHIQGSRLFVTYTIIQGIISSEMEVRTGPLNGQCKKNKNKRWYITQEHIFKYR